MIDFHTHILPKFDDGASSVEESLAMLGALKDAGFNHVVLSSHFYSNALSAEDFVSGRKRAFERLEAAAKGLDLPKLYLGAEVYVTPLLFNNESIWPITLNGGGVMLTELPYEKKFSSIMADNLEKLVYNCNVTPVLAHIERYPFLLDAGLLGELYNMGCRGQVNIGSFGGRYKRKLKKLAGKGFLFAIGSDSHCVKDAENVKGYLNTAIDTVGTDYLNAAFAYTKEKYIQC